MKKLDNYILTNQIGEGQSGKVYIGEDTNTKELVAIKQISRAKLHGHFFKLFEDQIKIYKTCTNNRILILKDILKSTNNIYLVTQYCEGGDLSSYLKRFTRIPQEQARVFFLEILEGFVTLRQNNVLHRDLKLANIFLKNGQIKIADFGFSKMMIKKEDKAHTILGSPLNMAPEILREEQYDSRADVYSLGVCYYQMIFGEYPFNGGSIKELLKKIMNERPRTDSVMISEQVQLLLLRMLQPDPAKRITFEELFKLLLH